MMAMMMSETSNSDPVPNSLFTPFLRIALCPLERKTNPPLLPERNNPEIKKNRADPAKIDNQKKTT